MRHNNHIIHRPGELSEGLQQRLNELEIELWKETARDLANRINDLVDAGTNGGRIMICDTGKTTFLIADPCQDLNPDPSTTT